MRLRYHVIHHQAPKYLSGQRSVYIFYLFFELYILRNHFFICLRILCFYLKKIFSRQKQGKIRIIYVHMILLSPVESMKLVTSFGLYLETQSGHSICSPTLPDNIYQHICNVLPKLLQGNLRQELRKHILPLCMSTLNFKKFDIKFGRGYTHPSHFVVHIIC